MGRPKCIAPFDQVKEVRGMAIPRCRILTARLQPLQPELADRLQHAEASLPIGLLFPLDETGGCERLKCHKNLELVSSTTHRRCRLQRPAPSEDGEPSEQS